MREVDLISAWEDNPDYGITVESVEHRIQIKFNGVTIADSENVLQLNEADSRSVYYFPIDDINSKHLCLTDKITFCPFKGLATHWALVSDNIKIEYAAWSYDVPFKKLKIIQNHIAFYPSDDIACIVSLKKTNNIHNYIRFSYDKHIALNIN